MAKTTLALRIAVRHLRLTIQVLDAADVLMLGRFGHSR